MPSRGVLCYPRPIEFGRAALRGSGNGTGGKAWSADAGTLEWGMQSATTGGRHRSVCRQRAAGGPGL